MGGFWKKDLKLEYFYTEKYKICLIIVAFQVNFIRLLKKGLALKLILSIVLVNWDVLFNCSFYCSSLDSSCPLYQALIRSLTFFYSFWKSFWTLCAYFSDSLASLLFNCYWYSYIRSFRLFLCGYNLVFASLKFSWESSASDFWLAFSVSPSSSKF